jgi:hypothetical protein
MKKQQSIAVLGMSLFCTLITWASSPVPFTAYDFTETPTGILATLEFDSQTDQIYNIARSGNLISNDWNFIVSDLPGTGRNMVYNDLAPLGALAHFYKASSTSAPPANILINAGFETGTPTADKSSTFDASPWQRYVNGANYNSWLTDDTFDPIIGDDNQALEFRWGVTFIYQDFTAIADRTYLFSVDVLNPGTTTNALTAQLTAEWYGASSNLLGTTILLDETDNATDPIGTWFELNGSAMAPSNAVTGRIKLICDKDGTQQGYFFDNAYVGLQPLGASVVSTDWTLFGDTTHAAAAQYAGLYAVANDTIQINRIDESIVDNVAVSNINGMAFTSSGRQLFISDSDSVQAYNVGTGQLRDFVTGLSLGTNKLGIAHFKGDLFVGTGSEGILRYGAKLDASTGTYSNTIPVGAAVRAITVDIQDEMLYVATPNDLYSLNPSNLVLTQIATVSNMVDITYGRTYGANGQGGLVILQDTGSERVLHLVSTATLQAGGNITPLPYYETDSAIPAIAATACGRLLAGGTTPVMLSDSGDIRMDFMTWVADEFDQNVLAAKSLCWQDSGNLTGMVNNTVKNAGGSRGIVGSPDAAYWVVNQLLMSHEVNGDPEAQGMVREIVKRYATLQVNSDGHWHHWFNVDTGDLHTREAPEYQTSLFSTMKACHMAIRAMEYYPNDNEIVDAAHTILGRLRNQRDYIREFGKQKSPADEFGPVPDSVNKGIFTPYIETHLFSELMAATEPMCENAYLDYWRYRTNHTVALTLPDEPIIRNNASGFWRMYDQSTIAHCRESEQWKQEFKNFYALFAGWTDDNAPEHLTAFSAGTGPSGYNADKYTNHPYTINSFGTVMGFGVQGDTVPVVGAYFAYRDDRRQTMEGSATYAGANMLTRISYEQPSWVLSSISPTDHQYAGYALGEILDPGSIDRSIAVHTYLEPQYDGNTVKFSRTVKRQIWGTVDGTNWNSLGFHHAPYAPDAGAPYIDYKVTGAEGELLEPISNQTYTVSADFDGTLYIVHAVSTNTTNLRVQWFNGATLLSEQTGSQTLEAIKPAGATELRADLSGATFEQISVVLDGKLETFSNAGFENGNFVDWSTTQQAGMGRANVADSRLEGNRACELTADVGADNGNYAQVHHEFDISSDPTNTHYVVEYDALTENLEGSSLQTHVKIYSSSNTVLRTEYFDTLERPNDQTMLSAGFRKRDADHTKLRFIIRLRRDDKSSVTAGERVLIDNLRLLKMKP